jgi:acyl transferase domain-containing protein/acyl carrier protein
VIKTVMAMREGVLPKTLHVDAPSSKVDWGAGEIDLLTEAEPWLANETPRRAGVSSFGISGTNAHLILEEAPAATADVDGTEQGGSDSTAARPKPGPIPLVLSAESDAALRAQAERLAAHLSQNPDLDPVDAGYSLATTRATFEHRAAALGGDREQLLDRLGALGRGEPAAGTVLGRALPGAKLAYLFTGQGSQRAAMGRELYGSQPAFAAALDEVCAELDQVLDRPLKDLLFADPGSAETGLLDHTAYAQPALFAIEVALHRLLAGWGLAPDLLAGHSVGEIAAAHVGGVLALPDAAKLVAARGRLMGELPEGGAMVAIEATESELTEWLSESGRELAIAAVNGPRAAVLSGAQGEVELAQAEWEEQGRKTKRLVVSHAFHSPLIDPMLEQFGQIATGLTYNEPKIPIVSSVSGELLSAEQATDPGYWTAQAREPVRFAAAVTTLREQGATALLELGPDAVLSAMAADCLASGEEEVALISTLRKDRDEVEGLAAAAAAAYAVGIEVDWAAFFTGARAVDLPTYAFQRRRYWLSTSSGSGDAGSIGQEDPGHPLLAAAIADPEGQGLTLTGRISLQSHPWLADHAVAGTVLLSGTTFLELALKAAEVSGCDLLEELTLQAPLVLPERGAVQIQVAVSDPAEGSSRRLAIHSRPEPAAGEAGEWTCHARGVLAVGASQASEPIDSWPPENAEPLELDDLYERLDQVGFEYGPAFQGLSAAWRDGGDMYVEVTLPVEQADQAGRYLLHPVLLDAAGHAAIERALGDGEPESQPRLPFAWQGVRVLSPGESSLRLRLALDDERAGLTAVDRSGAPVASIESIVMRPVDPVVLQAAARRGLPLHRSEWVGVERPAESGASEPSLAILGEDEIEGLEAQRYPSLAVLLEAIEAGAAVPDLLLADRRHAGGEDDLPAAAHAETREALELAQAFLAAGELEECRLAVLTSGAVAARDGEAPNLTSAPLWGLLRSAHSEHPGRFALIDSDESKASDGALLTALACSDEPQLALREGELLAPRLVRVEAAEEPAETLDPERTVLITGGTSGIGARLARHLAEAHGARRLLLVSRSGRDAAGVEELEAELGELGAEVTVAACDVADRAQLEALLEAIPDEHPLGAVFHSAAVLDDGVLDSLDAERLERVMRPKADAAWHLHELTAGTDLSAFVLFSSAAGVLGGAAQSNYAAANSFLDALAARRRADGMPATSLAWGLWSLTDSAMAAGVERADAERIEQQVRERLGFVPIAPEQGLAMLDAALALPDSQLVPVAFDAAVLRGQAGAGTLPAVLRGLVRVPAKRQREGASLAERLAAVAEGEREKVVLDLVRGHVAAVLGHSSSAAVEPERAFRDLGFDSLAAVELRNRLVAATGLSLPPTLVFDYPSTVAVAEYLLSVVDPAAGEQDEEALFRQELSRLPISRLRDAGLLEPLRELIGADGEPAAAAETDELLGEIDSMDLEDLVERTLEAEHGEAEDLVER